MYQIIKALIESYMKQDGFSEILYVAVENLIGLHPPKKDRTQANILLFLFILYNV